MLVSQHEAYWFRSHSNRTKPFCESNWLSLLRNQCQNWLIDLEPEGITGTP